MAFTVQNFALASVGGNQPLTLLSNGTYIGCFRDHNYHTQDSQQLVVAAGYFNLVANVIATGDYVNVYSTLAGVYVKYRPTNTNNVITAVALDVTLENSVLVTAAQLTAAFTTPVQLLPGLGAIYAYALSSVTCFVTYGGTQLTSGGKLGIQYGSAPSLGGILATNTIAGNDMRAIAANSAFILIPAAVAPSPVSGAVNTGLFLTNDTSDYNAGNNMTLRFTIKSSVIKVT